MLKLWKCKDSQKIRCLIKSLLKNSTQPIFQGGTPWMAQILNNIYNCLDGTLLCTTTFWACLWDLKGKSIESRFKWIESKLMSIEILSYQEICLMFNKENQLNVDSNELKVNWFQLKSFLIKRYLWCLKGQTLERRLILIWTLYQ